MVEELDAPALSALGLRLKEPPWVVALRREAFERYQQLPWPHASDDIWRRTDVSLLDPMRGFTLGASGLLQQIPLTQMQADSLIQPLGHELFFIRANGAWLTEPPASGSKERLRHVTISEFSEVAQQRPEIIRSAIEANGLTSPEQKLTSLNLAFHQDDLVVEIPEGFQATQPLRLVRLFSVEEKQAFFPLTIIHAGAGSSVLLIDEYLSLEKEPGGATPHLINGRIELVLEPKASVHYVRLQRWAPTAREFLLQRATLQTGSTLTMANLNLGAALSKAHIVTKLAGEQASSRLYGFVFGHQKQHIDQHTLQEHQAPRTFSDLHFRAALQDESRMIYTGLIRIAKKAVQTNAFQANHNLLLSQKAKAETIPMLEILADDVQCKHGASIGPIDEEQAFYLMSRGIPRTLAERLIVMGFIEPVIAQIPFEPLQQRLRQEIEGELRQA